MNLRSIGKHGLCAVLILLWTSFNSHVQASGNARSKVRTSGRRSFNSHAHAQAAGNAQSSSATHVSAEMTKGKLNPAESREGDQVALRLKDDVKSNGDVVLKKGTTITGVVRNVKRAEGKSKASGQAQSMMEVEWLVPAVQGRASQQLSIALQSVMQVNPIYAHEQEQSSTDGFGPVGGRAASSARSGGGLLGGAVSATTDVAGGVTSTAGAAGSTAAGVSGAASSGVTNSTRSSGQSNAALLSMPSIVAVDQQTTASLENTFGMASSTQLYKVGRGEMITSGGSKQSVDIFSHLSNDTVITSPSKDFEISGGAQMQLLVGVDKR